MERSIRVYVASGCGPCGGLLMHLDKFCEQLGLTRQIVMLKWHCNKECWIAPDRSEIAALRIPALPAVLYRKRLFIGEGALKRVNAALVAEWV